MTDEQKRVHFRLLTTLPVRAHFVDETPSSYGTKRNKDEEEVLAARLKTLEAAGYTRNEMKAKLGCSTESIIRHLGFYKKKGDRCKPKT